MAIIAVTTKSPGLDSEIEPRFGRAQHLLLVDSENLAWEVVENPAMNAGGGAGVQVASLLSERGVSAVASGEIGPNAHAALVRAGIAMHRFPEGTTCREAVERVKAGEPAVESAAESIAGSQMAGRPGLGQVLGGIAGGLMAGRGLRRREGSRSGDETDGGFRRRGRGRGRGSGRGGGGRGGGRRGSGRGT